MKMITAVFEQGKTTATAEGLYKFDYGQILRIKGLSLPKTVSVQFATEKMSEAILAIGITVETQTDVLIPNSLLRVETEPWDYIIKAYFYIVDGDSGKTEYVVDIPVKYRPRTGEDYPDAETAAAMSEVLAEVNDAVSKTEKTKAEIVENAASYLRGVSTTVTGDNYSEILPDFNNAVSNRIYAISGNPGILNGPPGAYLSGTLVALSYDNGATSNHGVMQLFFATSNYFYARLKWGDGTTWKDWICLNNVSACVYGVPTTVTGDNYNSLLEDLDNTTPNRIRVIASAPIANHPLLTENASGTLISMSPYVTSAQNGEIQQFFDKYGVLYTRRVWSGAYTPWHMESLWGKLAGKKMYCDGDSIAAGTSAGTDAWQKPYANQIAAKYGMTLNNAAVRSTTLAVRDGRTDSILERAQENLTSTVQDWILLDGGINDMYNTVPLGEISESYLGGYDTSTTVGALETLCRFIKINQPKARVLFILTHRLAFKRIEQDTYFNAIKKVLEKWSIQCLDLRYESGIVCFNNDLKALFTTDDNNDEVAEGLHPLTETYKEKYVPLIEAKMMFM